MFRSLLGGALLLLAGAALGADLGRAEAALQRGEAAVALDIYQQLARQGDAEAKYRLGEMYLQGRGVEADEAWAITWLRGAAAQGHSGARARLEALYQAAGLPPAAASHSGLSPSSPQVAQDPTPAEAPAAPTAAGPEAEPAPAAGPPRLNGLSEDEARALALAQAHGLRILYDPARRPAAEPGEVAEAVAEAREETVEAALDAREGAGGPEAEAAAASTGAEARGSGLFGRLFGGGDSDAQRREPAPVEERRPGPAPEDGAVAAALMAASEAQEAGAYGDAAGRYLSLAESGHSEAQTRLGALYQAGKGLPQDLDQARHWYRQAADQGHPEAQYHLGNMHLLGEGVPQDDVQALHWYRRAAEAGHEGARVNMDNLVRAGVDEPASPPADAAAGAVPVPGEPKFVPLDDPLADAPEPAPETGPETQAGAGDGPQAADGRAAAPASALEAPQFTVAQGRTLLEQGRKEDAFRLFRYLALQGDAEAQLELARLFALGDGVTRDPRAAAEWYRKAALQGNAEAQYQVGLAHTLGSGLPQDHDEAAEWYRQAAEQGHASAQFSLGLSHALGRGAVQDHGEAARWFWAAASRGHPAAQYQLGHLYRDGRGVERNLEEAIRWYRLAAEQGHPEARKELASLLPASG